MKVVTLRGLTENKFNEEREKLLSKGATSPPLFSTMENFIDSNLDKRIYVDMDTFLKKNRNGDF